MNALNPSPASSPGNRRDVLTRSIQIASQQGLESLSIGTLAAALHMSRSGLFYYMKSLESFQLELIDFAADLFKRHVVDPVLMIPSPAEKLRGFLLAWPGWTDASDPKLPGGCPLVGFLFELDGKAGPLRDRILLQVDRLDQYLSFLFQSCVAAKDFGPGADAAEFVHDCWGFYLPLLWERQRGKPPPPQGRLEAAVDGLIRRYRERRP